MKSVSASIALIAPLLGSACSSSNASRDSGMDSAVDVVYTAELQADNTGCVMDLTSGVNGCWYAYGDGVGPSANPSSTDLANSDCLRGGFQATDCTQINTPTPGQPFLQDAVTGAMCTSGVAAKVLDGPSGNPDYADLWGGGIALDFNNPPGDGGSKSTMDLSQYMGVAFRFTGTQIPMGKVRVNFPFLGQHGSDAPYYKGATLDNSMLTNNASVVIHWADIGGPALVDNQPPATPPPPFDPTKVFSIQFQVITNTSGDTPYQFCISPLTLLGDGFD
jgi:hypothetical protein